MPSSVTHATCYIWWCSLLVQINCLCLVLESRWFKLADLWPLKNFARQIVDNAAVHFCRGINEALDQIAVIVRSFRADLSHRYLVLSLFKVNLEGKFNPVTKVPLSMMFSAIAAFLPNFCIKSQSINKSLQWHCLLALSKKIQLYILTEIWNQNFLI